MNRLAVFYGDHTYLGYNPKIAFRTLLLLIPVVQAAGDVIFSCNVLSA
jgi:hypothetical protein